MSIKKPWYHNVLDRMEELLPQICGSYVAPLRIKDFCNIISQSTFNNKDEIQEVHDRLDRLQSKLTGKDNQESAYKCLKDLRLEISERLS